MMLKIGPESFQEIWNLLLQWRILVDYIRMTEFHAANHQCNWQFTFEGLALYSQKCGEYYCQMFHHILDMCDSEDPISIREFRKQYDPSLL